MTLKKLWVDYWEDKKMNRRAFYISVKFIFFVLCVSVGRGVDAQSIDPAVGSERQKIISEQDSFPESGFFDRMAGVADRALDYVTWEKPGYTFSIYPVVGYSPRTGLELGFMPVLKFNSEDADSLFDRSITITTSFVVSTKEMCESQVKVQGGFSKWMLEAEFQQLSLPDNFYGLGNDVKKFEPSSLQISRFVLSANLLRSVGNHFYWGASADFNRDDFKEDLSISVFDGVHGLSGGWANGIGPMIAYDSRDNLTYTSKGWFASLGVVAYEECFVSNYSFYMSELDVRKFISVKGDQSILAFQAFVSHSDGDVPFYKLSYIGGKRKLRGIPHPYKYLDNNSWLTQVEWRQKLWWRLGAVAFAGSGRVFSDFSDDLFSDLHHVAGVGLRFQALPKDGLNFRMDYGISNHDESGFFLTIRECF